MADPILLPDEMASENGVIAYVARGAYPDPRAAIARAMRECGGRPGAKAVAVLLRLESQVETKINGHEDQLWVECTARAKSPVAYWKVCDA